MLHKRQKVIVRESQGRWEIQCHAGDDRVLVVSERFQTRGEAETFLANARAALGGSVAGRWYQMSPDGQVRAIGNGHYSLGETVDRFNRGLAAAPYPPSPKPADVFQAMGKLGGNAAAAVTREVREYAVKLARERVPYGGWPSAPNAADSIMTDLRAYARERKRNPSARIVAEWLRKAGIKKGSCTQ